MAASVKLVIITFHFEFADRIESMLDKHEITDFVRFPKAESRDRDGRHYASKVFPGHSTVVHAQVPAERVAELLADLDDFKQKESGHRHLRALAVPVESII